MRLLTIADVGTIERVGPSSWRVYVLADHVCGLHGFSPMLGDKCPACDQRATLWKRRKELE